jgi:addiction module HigA family antidote
MNPPITPGEILLEEYLKPMGISQNAMARAIEVAPGTPNSSSAPQFAARAITPAMSIRFGAFFRQSPRPGSCGRRQAARRGGEQISFEEDRGVLAQAHRRMTRSKGAAESPCCDPTERIISVTFWHGIQVECDFRALAKQQKRLTAKIRPATELAHAA